MEKELKEYTYYVRGMHCASCEILIEKKIMEIEGVKSVRASLDREEVSIKYQGEELTASKLNSLFQKDGYSFSEKESVPQKQFSRKNILITFLLSFFLILGFIALSKSRFSELVSVNSKSSLPTFFLFGLLAGVSTCAALVGGMVLSLSKQWSELYSREQAFFKKFQPHLIFNLGRLVSYGFFGALLGLIGSRLVFSLGFSNLLVIIISLFMLFLGLQMLGLKFFARFQLKMPKTLSRYVSNEKKFQGRYMPFLLGVLTFFLPCGFTITAQSLALLSGSLTQGGLIMLSFALGTLLPLLFISFSSAQFLSRSNLSSLFLKTAGVLVIFFALFNINSQLNVLGLPSLNNISFGKNQIIDSGQKNNNLDDTLPPIVDGKQVIKMEASSAGYSPNYFKVRLGIPVRWEIIDKGTSGCTNAVISRDLFSGQIDLTTGQTSVKEFTPQTPGKYKFSCWMGMISGIIEVVDGNSPEKSSDISSSGDNNSLIPSGASGCGSEGSCSCGCSSR